MSENSNSELNNLNILYTEADPIINSNPNINAEDLHREITHQGFTVSNWLNNFSQKLFDPAYTYIPRDTDTPEDKQYYKEIENLITEMKNIYNEKHKNNIYKISLNGMIENLETIQKTGKSFDYNTEIILLDLYIEMLKIKDPQNPNYPKYPRFSKEKTSLII